jgi:aspartyl-tRNA(Asn)/glutamyl-tRNA(Gln) amidotransferase subunit A
MLDELSGVDMRDPTCIRDAQELKCRQNSESKSCDNQGALVSGSAFRVGKSTRALLRAGDAGFKDPTAPLSVKDMTDLLNRYESAEDKYPLEGVVVGVPEQFSVEGIDVAILNAWNDSIQKLADAGASIRRISLPCITKALPTYYVLVCAEASSNLSRYDGIRYGYRTPTAKAMQGSAQQQDDNEEQISKDFFSEISRTRGEGFGHEVVKRILTGTYVLSQSSYQEYYMEAVAWRQRILEESREALRGSAAGGVDVLIGPTAPILPFNLDNRPSPAHMMLCDIYTVCANLAGLPAVSLPVGTAGHLKLPIGMQLTGRYREESDLLRIARALEERCAPKLN